MGRTSDARDRLLNAAGELFGERSYSSVGVAELSKRAGVQKGSFYHFFPSKEALAVAVVDTHWDWQKAEWLRLLEAPGSVLARLRAVFDWTVEFQTEALHGNGVVTGCLFGNLALEVSSQSNTIRDRLQHIFEEQIALIEKQIRAGVDGGELDVADPRAAAKSVVAQLEGLILLAKLYNDPQQLESMWAATLHLLGAAVLTS